MTTCEGSDILLVDDIEDSAVMFAAALRSWGYVVFIARTIQGALDAIEFSPPIVISDLLIEHRPDGSDALYDGEVVLRRAREVNPSAFLVLWSAYASLMPEHHRERIMEVANLILPKPLPVDVYVALPGILPQPRSKEIT